MTVEEFINILEDCPLDFEIKFNVNVTRQDDKFIRYKVFDNLSIVDIGYSDKTICFDFEERKTEA